MVIRGLGGSLGTEETELLGAVGFVMMVLAKLAENPYPDRQGGYFTLLVDRHDPEEYPRSWLLGDIPEGEDGERLARLSVEKALRLRAHPTHLSSAQSQWPEQDQWPGAIAAGKHILSFSGLYRRGNEAAMLVVAIRLKLLDVEAASHIARLSENDLFHPLFEACSKGR